jgi:putative lipoprotein
MPATHPLRLAVGSLLLLASAACTGPVGTSPSPTPSPSPDLPPAAARPPARTFVYECPSGPGFVARVEPGAAWLFLPGRTVRLAATPSASGARFGGEGVVFWSRGERSTLEVAGQPPAECRNDPARAVWEDAKLRGVDFRATGNEPAWYLELSERQRVLLVTGMGGQRTELVAGPPETDPAARRTVYLAEGGGHRLRLAIEAASCRDSMSGEAFEARVTVRLDEAEYRGCGRALH